MNTRLGVLGWPVAHSRSPAMHNAALAALGLRDWRYQLMPVPPELFAETTRALGTAGFLGANVTIPHKQAALELADEADATALAIGAANTLTFREDGGIAAANTDAPGFIAAMDQAWGAGAQHGTAQVLGAGGSARAIVWALLHAGLREVMVWNRTAERASVLAGELGVRAVEQPQPADLLVNCTSVGLRTSAVQRSAIGEQDPLQELGLLHDQVGEYSHVADLVYTDAPTPLFAAATRAGAQTLDGLEILVAQGALSLESWTGLAAPIDVMRRAARGVGGDRDREDACDRDREDARGQGREDAGGQGREDARGQGREDAGGQGREDAGGQGREDARGQGREDAGGQGREDARGQGREDAGGQGREDARDQGREDAGGQGREDARDQGREDAGGQDREDARDQGRGDVGD